MLRKLLLAAAAVLLLVVVAAGAFVFSRTSAFDASFGRVYDVPPLDIEASSDPAVLARGEHLARSIGGCTGCHGADLGGGVPDAMGPVGTFTGPNLTRGRGGVGDRYDAGTMARAVAHGIGGDGTSLLFMPSRDFAWWPTDDLVAVSSYVLSAPPVDRATEPSEIGALGKILDRQGAFPLDAARYIDHDAARPASLTATPDAAYGEKLAMLCSGCHSPDLAGGPLPGGPPDVPPPSNLTPAGFGHYSEAQFRALLDTGTKPDGSRLHPFMPIESFGAMNDTEKSALFAYLKSLEPIER